MDHGPLVGKRGDVDVRKYEGGNVLGNLSSVSLVL